MVAGKRHPAAGPGGGGGRAAAAAGWARRNWFNLGVVAAVGLARLAPWVGRTGGPLRPEVTVKYALVALIFLLSGLALRARDLRAAAFNVRAHAVAQGFSFLAVPAAGALLVRALAAAAPSLVGPELRLGLAVLACLPPPVSSAVILTKAAGASEAVAIFNSTLGSVAGVLVSPLLLMAAVGGPGGSMPVGAVLAKMGGTVLLPLAAGQALQARVGAATAARWKERFRFSEVNSCILLVIIYCVFCDTFGRSLDVEPREVAACALVVACAHLALLAAATAGAAAAGLGRADVVAVGFVATHKSLTLGLPLLNILYEGDPRLVYMSLPLMLYHPLQILLGGSLVPDLKRWIADGRAREDARGVEMV